MLEVGAGDGELSVALAAAGYDVVAIDPASEAENVRPVALHELDEPAASFDAACAVVSLHHVEPLEESFAAARASSSRPGGVLVIDEVDFDRVDERAARWWLEQRADTEHDVETVLGVRAHMHPVARLREALAPWFELGEPVRGPVPVPLGHASRRARRGGAADRGRRAAGHGRAARRDQKTLSVRRRRMPPTCTVTRYLPRPRGRTNAL